MIRARPGQSLTEQAMIIGVAVAALMGMQTFIKRGLQAGVKNYADEMGKMALPCVSLSTTMGMLVAGSIMSFPIFISTSIVASPGYVMRSPTRLFGPARFTFT